MGTAKRARQKQARQERIEQAIAAQQRQRKSRTVRNLAIAAVVVIVGAFLLSRLIGSDDDRSSTATDGSTTTTTAAGSSTTTTPRQDGAVPIAIPAAGASISGATPCPPAEGAAERTTVFEQAPPTCIDPSKTYLAEISTSKGDFTVELDPEAAPLAVNNFVVLSRYKYYEGVAFHRIVTGFVNQAGDAAGPTPGTGGPGYQFADELPSSASVYTEGALAMANSGPNTNGSQFFVVVGNGGAQLQPLYTKFGQVTEGIEVVRAINQLATNNNVNPPTAPELVTIESVTITER